MIAYRLGSGGWPLMIAGMAAAEFYFTAAYGRCFSIIEEESRVELKATATDWPDFLRLGRPLYAKLSNR